MLAGKASSMFARSCKRGIGVQVAHGSYTDQIFMVPSFKYFAIIAFHSKFLYSCCTCRIINQRIGIIVQKKIK